MSIMIAEKNLEVPMNEITINKAEFEDLIREIVTDTAAQIADEVDVEEGFKCTLFGAIIAKGLTDKLFNTDDLEVEKNG